MKILKDGKILILLISLVVSILLITFKGVSPGIDLSGGSVIVLKSEKPMNDEELTLTIDILGKRLNANGLSDVRIYPRGNDEIIVEIPKSADLERIEKILSKQGVFVAKIDNITAYTGKDVKSVEPPQQIPQGNDWAYGVPFELTLEGAKNFAKVAEGKAYHRVELYMDGKLISNPTLAEGLADGKPHPKQVITVGPYPPSKEEEDEAMAIYAALKSGSLPVKVNIEYVSSISPTLGKEFVKGALIAGLLAFIAVGVVVGIRYKKPKIILPILFTCASEILLILGFASLINWKIDLASIAGIIAAVGTGVDDQIVITDEALGGEKRLKKSIRRAFFIIFAAAGTTIAAMVPLFVMGVGMLKGFAITTIAGVLIGVFITRPAFARIIGYII
ncbi:preprotein translocase subunit SecD [Methanotorris formicicus]|uniref:Protein-export membrane protein SecD n=1 Tax=Methanotorris formicicus Mc-S-70 TaxID=647171 RepID=H1KWX4_9EURY|nr:preprotein translocase subunit SecD [Methanotorris formicicus]EHP89107.1 SecD/SecF/SecDF export membrane protein [Methanotorris formicicus Mc-S-70]